MSLGAAASGHPKQEERTHAPFQTWIPLSPTPDFILKVAVTAFAMRTQQTWLLLRRGSLPPDKNSPPATRYKGLAPRCHRTPGVSVTQLGPADVRQWAGTQGQGWNTWFWRPQVKPPSHRRNNRTRREKLDRISRGGGSKHSAPHFEPEATWLSATLWFWGDGRTLRHVRVGSRRPTMD